ncbi:MAG: hypothetical protein IJT69_01845 [Clostridia bacterium]|nr:hypothetical protein [Clostridia bacterium]
MKASDQILSVISERKEITVPELQMALSLPYKTVRAGVEELVKKGVVTYVGGMTFRINEGAASAQARENAPVVMTERLRRIAEAAAEDPRLASMIDRFSRSPDMTFGISKFQILLRIGYIQAHTLRDKCCNLGILSSDGRCILSPRECLAVLGRTETGPVDRQSRSYTKGFLTPEEFVDRLRKEEEDAPSAPEADDNLIERILKGTNGGENAHFKGPQEDPDDDFPFEFDEDVDLDAEDEDEEDEFDGDRFWERAEEDDEDEESEEPSEGSSAEELKAARQRLWERFERIRAQNNADEDDEEKDAETEEEDDDREEADDYDGDFDGDFDDDFSAIAEDNDLAAMLDAEDAAADDSNGDSNGDGEQDPKKKKRKP